MLTRVFRGSFLRVFGCVACSRCFRGAQLSLCDGKHYGTLQFLDRLTILLRVGRLFHAPESRANQVKKSWGPILHHALSDA